MKIQAVIFDMDGVLIDSEPQYQKEIIACLKEQNISVTLADLKPLAGGTDMHYDSILGPILNKKKISMAAFNELLTAYLNQHPFHYANILNLGVHKTLKELKKHGIILALASSSPKKQIERVMHECELEEYFQFSISGEIFRESKPHPEIYLTALQKLGLSSEHVVAIEDSTYGIQAAKRAGLYCIAKRDMRYDYHQELADHIINEIPELLSFLLSERGE